MGHSSGLLCSHVMTRTQHLTYLEEYNCILRFFFFFGMEQNFATFLSSIFPQSRLGDIYIYIKYEFWQYERFSRAEGRRKKAKRKSGGAGYPRGTVVKDTQELRQERGSNWKTSFSAFSLLSSPVVLRSCLLASTHERFMGRVKDTPVRPSPVL